MKLSGKVNYGEIRREYLGAPLDEEHLNTNPLSQFEEWFQNALDAGVLEPNAMMLSTVDREGTPSARIVLFKGLSNGKITFFTNYTSIKASEIAENPKVSILFFWAELARQVRIKGELSKITREESHAYFQTRPRYSQIAAWASAQSRVIKNRKELEDNFQKYIHQFGEKGEIPTPQNWGGYSLNAEEWEFWQGRENRMHDRIRYRKKESEGFSIDRLSP